MSPKFTKLILGLYSPQESFDCGCAATFLLCAQHRRRLVRSERSGEQAVAKSAGGAELGAARILVELAKRAPTPRLLKKTFDNSFSAKSSCLRMDGIAPFAARTGWGRFRLPSPIHCPTAENAPHFAQSPRRHLLHLPSLPVFL